MVSQAVRNLGRTNFPAVSLIFCLIVKKFIVCHDFDYRQGHIGVPVIIYGTRKLTSRYGSLGDKHVSLSEGNLNSLVKISLRLHFRHTEAASAVSWLHEHRKAKFLDSICSQPLSALPFPDENVISTFHEIHTLEISLAGKLVKSDGRHKSAASAVRNTEHLKIALHQTVFPGCPVLHYIRIVELDFLSVQNNGKVRLVNLRAFLLWNGNPRGPPQAESRQSPAPEPCEYLIHVIFFTVNLRGRELPAAQRNLPLRRVAAINNCYRSVTRHFNEY